jgi:hypothetical protein
LNSDDLREFLDDDKGDKEVQQEILVGRERFGIKECHSSLSVRTLMNHRRPRKKPYAFSGAQKSETL